MKLPEVIRDDSLRISNHDHEAASLFDPATVSISHTEPESGSQTERPGCLSPGKCFGCFTVCELENRRFRCEVCREQNVESKTPGIGYVCEECKPDYFAGETWPESGSQTERQGREKYPAGAVVGTRCSVCYQTEFHTFGCRNGTYR